MMNIEQERNALKRQLLSLISNAGDAIAENALAHIESLEAELVALSQPQGEPVAWESKSDDSVLWFKIPPQDVEHYKRKVGYQVRSLFTAPPAPAQPVAHNEKVFTVNILRNPMRESSPGVWENAVWPSEVAQPVALSDDEISKIWMFAPNIDTKHGFISVARKILSAQEAK